MFSANTGEFLILNRVMCVVLAFLVQQHKMEDGKSKFNIEKLIDLIKSRPALYDKSLLGYSDHRLKQKLWLEICEIMTPRWVHHTLSEQALIGTKLQKKWQDIKSTFQKELQLQKVERLLGTPANKRKKYQFFDKLTFLMPTMNIELPHSSSIQVHSVRTPVVPDTTTTNSHRFNQTSGQVHKNKRKQPNKEPYLKIFNIRPNREIDEDNHFLLSIVPSLQRMSPTQKIRVKMMFLQAIHDIEEETQRTPPCPQFVGNEIGYNQARQFGSPPTSCTITSNNLSNPPSLTQSTESVVQSSPILIQSTPRPTPSPPRPTPSPPRPIQSPPRPIQSPPRPIQSPPRLTPSPPRPIQSLPRPIQNPPRLISSPPREIQSSPNPAPQQTNEEQLSTVWIKDNSVLFEQPPEQAPNCFKCEIVIDD